MYKSVIIALDGSQQAAKAVPQGIELASKLGARVVLLRVVPSESDLEASGASLPDAQRAETSADVLGRRDYESRRSQAEGYLSALGRSARVSGLVVETRVEEGDPVGAIGRVAKSLPEPVVVITPYGRSASLTPPATGVFGRIADRVLRESCVPVLVAKA